VHSSGAGEWGRQKTFSGQEVLVQYFGEQVKNTSSVTNGVVSLIKQLWSGEFIDDLMRAGSNGIWPWEEIKATPFGVELGGTVRGRCSEIIKIRPTSFSKGAAANRRQLGTDSFPCPANAAAEKKTMVPMRGDILRAESMNVSLPIGKAIPTVVGGALVRINECMKNFKSQMLKS